MLFLNAIFDETDFKKEYSFTLASGWCCDIHLYKIRKLYVTAFKYSRFRTGECIYL